MPIALRLPLCLCFRAKDTTFCYYDRNLCCDCINCCFSSAHVFIFCSEYFNSIPSILIANSKLNEKILFLKFSKLLSASLQSFCLREQCHFTSWDARTENWTTIFVTILKRQVGYNFFQMGQFSTTFLFIQTPFCER